LQASRRRVARQHSSEVVVVLQRAEHERPASLASEEPSGEIDTTDPRTWQVAADVATVGIFILLGGACLYFCRYVLLPVLAAVVIATTLAPLVRRADRYRIPVAVTSVALVLIILALGAIGLTLLSALIYEWVGRAPEIGATLQQKLTVLDRPLAALRQLKDAVMPHDGNTVTVDMGPGVFAPVVGVLTPALVQIVLFVGTLIFYLIEQTQVRKRLVSMFTSRDAKLRFLRIVRDIEEHLTAYLGVVTVVNVCLGLVVACGAWLFGLPNPVLIGLLAGIMNYIPYIGPAFMVVALFSVGIITLPTLLQALIPAVAFVALATLEGQFITPTALGRRLTLNPLAIFLSLAFWAWLWGPIGAFLAVPLDIAGTVTFNHLFPGDDVTLPG
jgi:predicted PurR-regulated permease PerM